MRAVVASLTELGGDAHVLSARQLPRDGCVALDGEALEIGVDGTRVRLGDCVGVWQWHAAPPKPSDEDEAIERYVRREWELVLRALAACSSAGKWINHPPRADWLEANKLAQAKLAVEAGFDVPPTLVSNDPDRILAFARQHGTVAVKSQGGAWRARPEGPVEFAYTQCCTYAELDASRDALSRAPVVVQPYLDKADELRVTVVDTTVFACRIDSQASERTRLDWRRDVDAAPHHLVDMQPLDEARVLALARAAGLRYAAIDLLRARDGRTYFLDLNPQGQFGWIEARTGAPITRTLASALLAGPS